MKRGRPRKSGKRDKNDRLIKESGKFTPPPEHIEKRRKLWSFVSAPKGGEIDSEICDALGQLCALGLLDHHGFDPVELRDKGRFWGGQYVARMKCVGPVSAAYEPRSRTTGQSLADTPADLLFERMDENLPAYERARLLELIVEPLIGEKPTVPWAQSLIDMALLERKRLPENRVVKFPTMQDREFLNAAIRGLVILVDGSLPSRWERAA
jgi:hypothetical protein